jgi:hypothetical protein
MRTLPHGAGLMRGSGPDAISAYQRMEKSYLGQVLWLLRLDGGRQSDEP